MTCFKVIQSLNQPPIHYYPGAFLSRERSYQGSSILIQGAAFLSRKQRFYPGSILFQGILTQGAFLSREPIQGNYPGSILIQGAFLSREHFYTENVLIQGALYYYPKSVLIQGAAFLSREQHSYPGSNRVISFLVILAIVQNNIIILNLLFFII